MIKIKRVYEKAESTDGTRFLVDRIWPRGIKKENLPMQAWLKEVAPSNELRHEYHHSLYTWEEFKQKYFQELEASPNTWEPILTAANQGIVTLLYSARDKDQNNAIALREFLDKQIS